MPRDSQAYSRSRSRSRSPRREHSDSNERSYQHAHTRSRSQREPHRHKKRRTRSPSPALKTVVLPYKAKPLSKRHYDEYIPLFQSYLDIQKHLNLDELDEREAKGRWKSFVSRWNRGDLARSWYDPSMLKTAQDTISSFRPSSPIGRKKRASPQYEAPKEPRQDTGNGSESEDEFGPAPPRDVGHAGGRRAGPTIPRADDLALRDEEISEERDRQGRDYRDDIRYERKTDRKAQKERLDELVPRADPGSRERQLEKKRETGATLKEFRDAKEAGDIEVKESDLMGEDDLDAFKRQKRDMEKKKTEREIRREEIMRARAAEQEERLAERREKESKTMDFLKQLAKERYG